MLRTLGRTKDHRISLLRNLGRSFVIAETLTTTLPKAKEVKRLIDRWVAQAKRANGTAGGRKLTEYRKLLALTHDQPAAQKLVTVIAPRTGNRVSGFTRLARIVSRVGDAAPRGRLIFTDQAQIVKEEPKSTKIDAPKVTVKPAKAKKA